MDTHYSPSSRDKYCCRRPSGLFQGRWSEYIQFFEKGKVRPEFQKEYDKRIKMFMPYQLNAKLINTYAPKAGIMHCMPCHIGYEITRDAIDHPNSLIFGQAENRMHIQKGIIMWLLS